ncbi:hypothetical protein [Nocardioides sp. SYSU D00065]|uniref:hypothetical protein n=1 Tax=Nocardioides sp. SYSU D00065 TaxID=2817378 RepID=UPI001B337DC4|nr:hypothetical protein [Nocardioides sp. SYSU D00065]
MLSAARLTAVTVLLLATLGAQLVTAGSASAGQVGVTTYVRGAGTVRIVEGTIEDDAPTVCNFNDQQDHHLTRACTRVRNSEVFEAWVWLRAEPSPIPADNWVFDGWTGCDETREVDGFVECGVHSGAFSSVEAAPLARFVDVRPPELGDVEASQDRTIERTATFRWLTDGATTQCQFDQSGSWTHCIPGMFRQFPEGEHRIDVRAFDTSLNQSAVRTALFDIVDTEIVSGPGALSNSTSATFGFASSHAEDYVCSLDGGAEWPCATSATPTTTLTGLRSGLHGLSVRARHGNAVDQVPATIQWRVDTLPPETTITGFDATTDGVHATFTGDDAASFECRLTASGNVGAWATCTSPLEITDLAAGTYRLEVRGIDRAGNADPTPEVRTWQVGGGTQDPGTQDPGTQDPGTQDPGTQDPGTTDPGTQDPGTHAPGSPDTRAPDTAITGGPVQDGIVLDRSVRLTYSADEAVQAWRCTLDGEPVSCGAGAVALSGVAAGSHTFAVAAVDGAGHVDATPATRSFTVPHTAKEMKKKGFRIKRSAKAWAGVEARATRRGARLSHSVRDARWIALVVTTSKRGGTIVLQAGGRKRTIRLTSPSTLRHRIVRVPAFTAPWSGKVRITVKSSKRPVVVEGIAVGTS